MKQAHSWQRMTNNNKSGKLSQHTPVLPQVAMAKFNYKKTTKGNNS